METLFFFCFTYHVNHFLACLYDVYFHTLNCNCSQVARHILLAILVYAIQMQSNVHQYRKVHFPIKSH